MLIGNVGKEPDVHYYDADQAVAKVSLATTERGYTLKNGTQTPDHTDWHNLVFYRQLAQISFTWKVACVIILTTISKENDTTLQRLW